MYGPPYNSQYASRPPPNYGSQGYGPPPGNHSQYPNSGYSNPYPPPPQQYGPPPGGDPQLWQWFSAVDSDRSGSISVTELQSALVNGNDDIQAIGHVSGSSHKTCVVLKYLADFDLDTVKMLMGIFDTDRSGTINFAEFCGLWKYIADWQNVFRHFDRDHSGSIESGELAEAMRNFGYNLSPSLINLIENKYGPPTRYGRSPGITFDRFVRACVAVKTLTEAFQRVDVNRSGWVQLSYDQFMDVRKPFLGQVLKK
ncbi:hypothetical protein H0H92_012261 [Tricholoma furcatifolium]|nr:hypothetical protein H0H92_012261 [Tricholoma furcatifolium]